MLNTLFDKIGDWNPQLMRELKGRFTPRNLILVVVIAAVLQALLLVSFASHLPASPESISENSRYIGESTEHFINWKLWWQDIFRMITWALPYALMAAGSYMVITDLGQEERRGTLNFLRLSPQSAREILVGKLLGVPSLAYFGLGLIIPLHLIAAIGASISPAFIISYYLLLGVASYLCFSGAMLVALLNKGQKQSSAMPMEAGLALLYLLLVIFSVVPTFMFWNLITVWQVFAEYLTGSESYPIGLTWFYLPISDNPLIAHAFVLGNLGAGIYLIWQVLHRCYHNPTGTILSKAQGYGINLYTDVLLLGFLFPTSGSLLTEWRSESNVFGVIVMLAVWHLVKFAVLMAVLSPQRQALLDWSRYRHQMTAHGTHRRSLVQDLLWGEKSPSGLAIAVNLGMLAAIWLPMLLPVTLGKPSMMALVGFGLNICLIMIYTTIVQLLLLMKTNKPTAWATGVTATVAFLPPILVLLVTSGMPTGGVNAGLLLFTPLLWATIGQVSMLAIGLSCLGQVTAIVLLNMTLAKRLRKLGESTTKLLLKQA